MPADEPCHNNNNIIITSIRLCTLTIIPLQCSYCWQQNYRGNLMARHTPRQTNITVIYFAVRELIDRWLSDVCLCCWCCWWCSNYVYSVMETYMNSAYTTRYKCCNGWTHLHGQHGCTHSTYCIPTTRELFAHPTGGGTPPPLLTLTHTPKLCSPIGGVCVLF